MTAEDGDDTGQTELRRELAQRHRDAFAWAQNCCRSNRTDAEDVLQATYVKVLEGRARFDRRSTFTTWLFGVIRLTALDHRRRQFVRELVMGRAAVEESMRDPAPPPEADLGRAQRRAALQGALTVLPRRQREVLLLVFYHELTIEDAARVMAIGVGSARQHYARGKVRLREVLAHLKEVQ
ncbi:MAG: sigma-70 family RNA polymerase sigma factor [Casimicrobiaceae bacterium]